MNEFVAHDSKDHFFLTMLADYCKDAIQSVDGKY